MIGELPGPGKSQRGRSLGVPGEAIDIYTPIVTEVEQPITIGVEGMVDYDPSDD